MRDRAQTGPLVRRRERLARFVTDELPLYCQPARPAARGCLIFAQGRTGTWLLHSLLNQHPELIFDKEVLEQPVLMPFRYMLARSRRAGELVYGCHVQPHHLIHRQEVDPDRFIARVAGLGWRILHVTRHDIVRQSISAIVAVQRGRWVDCREGPTPQAPITIDIDAVLARIARREAHLAIEARIMTRHHHLHLVYEDDLCAAATHQATASKIFAYLGVPDHAVQATTARILPDRLETLVINHDQLMVNVAQAFPHLMPGSKPL